MGDENKTTVDKKEGSTNLSKIFRWFIEACVYALAFVGFLFFLSLGGG